MDRIAIKKHDSPEAPQSLLAGFEKRMEQIRQRAYELFERRGGEIGRDMDDWLAAERDIDGLSKAELVEKDGACEVRVTLPGFEAKEVTVTAMPQALLIEAVSEQRRESPAAPEAVKGAQKENESRVVWSEFRGKEVFRQIDLPQTANLDQVKATLDNGVLTIDVPYTSKVPAKPYPTNIKIAVA